MNKKMRTFLVVAPNDIFFAQGESLVVALRNDERRIKPNQVLYSQVLDPNKYPNPSIRTGNTTYISAIKAELDTINRTLNKLVEDMPAALEKHVAKLLADAHYDAIDVLGLRQMQVKADVLIRSLSDDTFRMVSTISDLIDAAGDEEDSE